jgi:hypothetical protein
MFLLLQPSMDINITLEFGAHPKPRPQDVVWVIKNDIKTIEVRNFRNKCIPNLKSQVLTCLFRLLMKGIYDPYVL